MKWADQTLSKMPLERKIGQMIYAEIAGGYIAEDDPRLQQWIKLARDYAVGMLVLYGGTPRDVERLPDFPDFTHLNKPAKDVEA